MKRARSLLSSRLAALLGATAALVAARPRGGRQHPLQDAVEPGLRDRERQGDHRPPGAGARPQRGQPGLPDRGLVPRRRRHRQRRLHRHHARRRLGELLGHDRHRAQVRSRRHGDGPQHRHLRRLPLDVPQHAAQRPAVERARLLRPGRGLRLRRPQEVDAALHQQGGGVLRLRPRRRLRRRPVDGRDGHRPARPHLRLAADHGDRRRRPRRQVPGGWPRPRAPTW